MSTSSALAAPAAERTRPKLRTLGNLLLASMLSLFVELLLIRWIPSTVHLVAFFNNLVLMACFLGLGIGMARPIAASRAVWRGGFRLAVTTAVFATLNLLEVAVVLPAGGDYGVNEFQSSGAWLFAPMFTVLLLVFAVAVWTSIPFGQLVAGCFDQMERIPAYSINVAGSLLGVLTFAALSWLEMPPVVWFAVALGLLALIHADRQLLMPCAFIVLAISMQHLYYTRGGGHVFWSPYYKIVAYPQFTNTGQLDDGFVVKVNDQVLLFGIDLSDRPRNLPVDQPDLVEVYETWRPYYNFPYTLRPAKRVLVLGAGAGNDVAAALRHGAEHVTAVEIDPVVLRLGKQHHPEKPYDSPRVTVVYDDARAYLNRTPDKFDLIIFGTLDAHGMISSLGNVRLDSFVYTRESIAAARNRLSDDGLMVLSFGPFREEVQYRQYATVASVFAQQPLYFSAHGHFIVVAGALDSLSPPDLPKDWRRIEPAEIDAKLTQYPQALMPATDDWPHLYIRHRAIPREYLLVLAGVLALSVLLIAQTFRGTHGVDSHFFMLGAGFLLLETKSVTEFALLIGATWQVNALVFAVIMLMILLANMLVQTIRKRIPLPVCYALLALCLTVGYFWPIRFWATHAGSLVLPLAVAYLGVPIFLAAIIFASTFREARLGSGALASNLLGAVLGGTMEYLSIALGIQALSLLALGLYLASLGAWWAAANNWLPLRARRIR